MMYEIIATLRIARDEHGIYVGVVDFMDGGAPESVEGHDTLEGLCTRVARMVAATQRERDGELS
jgi:hypothetical protein